MRGEANVGKAWGAGAMRQKLGRHYFQGPTEAQLALKPGDKVKHWDHGIGWVKAQWGAWFACRECFMPLAWCGHWTAKTNLISGEGVFEVEFENGEQKPINCVWLEPL